MRNQFVACAAVIAFLLFTASPIQAATRAELAKENLAKQAKAVVALTELKTSLQAKPSSEWHADEIQEYLDHALWDVSYGAVAYVLDNRVAALDSTTLIRTGYVTAWPENPFNNWQPMKLITANTDFKPGDLCLMICPEDFYSGYQTLVPRSFEMCVFGPSVEFAAEHGEAQINQLNTWASVPDGAVYQRGYYTTTHSQLMESLNGRN